MGLGFTLVLTGMGAIREILGSGTLFANASLLLGPHFEFLEVTVIPDYRGFLILILPPGGFMILSFILAAQKKIQAVARRRTEKITTTGGEQCV